MHFICCLAVLLVHLVWQASSHQPTQRKSIRLEAAVDYDPNNQTVLLNITLGRPTEFRFVNNFEVQVLRWLGNCSGEEMYCSLLPSSEVTVVQSRRICLAPWTISASRIHCHQIIPAELLDHHTVAVSVQLQHIFTGCYCFRLATYRDDSIRTARQLLERPLLVETNVIEYDVFKWNLSLDLSATGHQHDLTLFIRLDDQTDFDIYHVELFRHEESGDDLTACHETDDPMNEHLTVTLDQLVHWMTFYNRSQGYYCVVIIPEDDRCHPPLVDDVHKTCARHSNIVQLIATDIIVPTFYSQTAVIVILVAGLTIVLAAISVMVYFLVNGKMKPTISVADYFPIDNNNHKLIKQNTPVLLFYSHDNKEIQQHVGRVKNAIRTHVSTIYDDADDEDSLDVEGVEWFTKYLQVANIRIVIIVCAEMMRCQEWMWNRRLDDINQIDQLCLYRLQELIQHPAATRIFSIYFDDLDDQLSNPSSCFLTPYHRSYRWPAEQNAFLSQLGRQYPE